MTFIGAVAGSVTLAAAAVATMAPFVKAPPSHTYAEALLPESEKTSSIWSEPALGMSLTYLPTPEAAV